MAAVKEKCGITHKSAITLKPPAPTYCVGHPSSDKTALQDL